MTCRALLIKTSSQFFSAACWVFLYENIKKESNFYFIVTLFSIYLQTGQREGKRKTERKGRLKISPL